MGYINREEKAFYSEIEVDQMYDAYLDELYNTGNWCFSELLKDYDPIAYDVGFDDYLDSMDLEESDSDPFPEIEEDS